MSYQLKAGENLGRGVRRLCRSQIQAALVASQTDPAKGESPVHETRKHLNKTRAAIRLLAPSAGRRRVRKADAKLGRVARLLSEMRDAEVRFQTVKQLRALLPIGEAQVSRETEIFLQFERESFFAAFADWEKTVPARLKRILRHLPDWRVDQLSCRDLRETLQQTYKRGRKALGKVSRRPTDKNFHTLRKRAKELTHQLSILRPLHPTLLAQLIEELKILTGHLGKAHDLCSLQARLKRLSQGGSAMSADDPLVCLIKLRERKLQGVATTLAERFYAERPKKFAHHLCEFFEEWAHQLKAPSTQRTNGSHSQPETASGFHGSPISR